MARFIERVVMSIYLFFSYPFCVYADRKVQIAGGLHQICAHFCFNVQGGSDTDLIPPLAEKEFYLNLYDDLLSTAIESSQVKFSLVQSLCVVKLFAYRVLIWSREVFSFI